MEMLAGVAVGAVLGLVGKLAADKFRAYRVLFGAFRRFRDRPSTVDRVVEQLERDPYFGREYARPTESTQGVVTVS